MPAPSDPAGAEAGRTDRRRWLAAGALSGFTGLALSYALAGLLGVREAPVVAVAEGFTQLLPGGIVHWAIDTFGTADKLVLLVGMMVVLGVVFALIGRLARTRWWPAVAAYVALAVIGSVAVFSRSDATAAHAVPLIVGLCSWIIAMAVLRDQLVQWGLAEAGAEPGLEATRRGFLVGAGILGAIAVAGGAVGRFVGGKRRNVEESRELLRLDVSEAVVPEGAELDVSGLRPWQTPADDFYLIDTAFTKPAIEPSEWRLRIHGLVDREIELTYDDLLARKLTEDWITLNCVSNEIGGSLIGNAWWSGVRLAPLLEELGVHDGADAVLQTSEDGWTCGTPLSALTDDRNAMLAVAMNGEPLPIEHGFPVRTIVPGLYGYVSATKWVVDMEVTRFDDISAYWTDRGWGELGPVKMASRIDVPADGDEVDAGTVVVAGTAWMQHTGIEGVEVSLDGGAWTPAVLARVPNEDTWVQWRVELQVGEGEHDLRVRATDATGDTQTSVVTGVLPDGATGWHEIRFEAV